MLKPVRIKAGLGSPPEHFSTNASESVNAVLKAKVDYKRNELPTFVRKMEELVKDQKTEFKLAIINRGKFQVRPAYQSLGVPEDAWFQMDKKAREDHVAKFHRMVLKDIDEEPQNFTSTSELSVDVNVVSDNSSIPLSVYQGIWEKARRLLCQEGSMAPAPGYPPEARTVQSTSKTGFHLVTSASSGRFSCDCANYRSLNICSHSVAVAEVNKKLGHFVDWYRKANKLPSLSKLATADVPKGRGRKGGQPPRKKQKKVPISTRVDTIQAGSSADTPCSSTSNTDSTLSVPTPTTTPQSSQYCPTPDTRSYTAPSAFPPLNSYPYTSVPSSCPWWQASYVNNGNQTLQQFHSAGYSSPLPMPPSLPHNAGMIFHVRFISGNISICYGCRNKYSKKPCPPDNLCLQTEEWREYTPQGGHSAAPQTRSRWANTYYHLSVTCVQLRWPFLDPQSQVVVEDNIRSQLMDCHRNLLQTQLGLYI